MTVPFAVAAAARAWRSSAQDLQARRRTVRRGDLRLITAPCDASGQARLGLVLNVDTTLEFIEIALVHPYSELATSMDSVVPGELAGTTFDVVVQTDLRGVVWTLVQASRAVGQLSMEILEVISNLVEMDRPTSTTGIRIGTPLAGPHDRRWSFKATEGKALDSITSDCASEVIDGGSPWKVSPELFIPKLLASTSDLDLILIELAHLLSTRNLRLTVEDAQKLEQRGALEIEAWRSVNLSTDLYYALMDIALDALTQTRAATVGELSKCIVAPYSPPQSSQGAEVVHVLGTLVES